jgi:alanine racemase
MEPIAERNSAANSRPHVLIDLDSVRDNIDVLSGSTTAEIMAVVKSDAYGHGLVEISRVALERGATWLAVGTLAEARALRAAGIHVPILLLRRTSYAGLRLTIQSEIDVSVGDLPSLTDAIQAAHQAGKQIRIHLEVDTGISRGGFTLGNWPRTLELVAEHTAEGCVLLVGVWMHFSHSDLGRHPRNVHQLQVFQEALSMARRHGLIPLVRHAANTTAMLTSRQTHLDLVRPGSGMYGIIGDGRISRAAEFVPAMTVKAPVVGLRSSGARLADVALRIGAVHGICGRAAGSVWATTPGGSRAYLTERIGLEWSVWRARKSAVDVGDELMILGPGITGEATVYDWSRAMSTIANEIAVSFGHSLGKTHIARPRWSP